MSKILYAMVTQDKYQLPILVTDTGRELSKILGLNPDTVAQYIYHDKTKVHSKYPRYIKVEVDDE